MSGSSEKKESIRRVREQRDEARELCRLQFVEMRAMSAVLDHVSEHLYPRAMLSNMPAAEFHVALHEVAQVAKAQAFAAVEAGAKERLEVAREVAEAPPPEARSVFQIVVRMDAERAPDEEEAFVLALDAQYEAGRAEIVRRWHERRAAVPEAAAP
jgi:hypothetical protein